MNVVLDYQIHHKKAWVHHRLLSVPQSEALALAFPLRTNNARSPREHVYSPTKRERTQGSATIKVVYNTSIGIYRCFVSNGILNVLDSDHSEQNVE